MDEIWKPIPQVNNYYEISNLGRVRSADRIITRSDGRVYRYNSKIMKIFKASPSDVTARVELSMHNKHKSYYISSLVAQAFLDVPYCSTMIFNIDGDPNNNVLSNLTLDLKDTYWYQDKISADEEWRDVTNYSGIYQVSSYGRFRTLPRMIKHTRCGYNFRKGVIHSYSEDYSGDDYISVQLWRDGKYIQRQLHVLIAEAFLPNLENKPQVNHKDGNKRNNAVSNLDWVTAKQNSHHAISTGLNKLSGTGKPVKDLDTGIVYQSISDAARRLNINHSSVKESIYRGSRYAGKLLSWA